MKTARLLILVLCSTFFIGSAQAQMKNPENMTPPNQLSQPQHPGLTVPANGEKKDGDDDEIIVIPGPKIGKREDAKPQLSPEIFEMLYKAVWQKVGKEYHDPYKLSQWAEWENKFKGQLKSEAELDQAIKQMLASLNDRWTLYYSPADIQAQKQASKDGIISIGMLLRPHSDKAWHIDGMQFGTPAMQSTLREGDVIKSVNGKSLAGMSQSDVTHLLMGKEGDKLSVVAVYDGAEHTVELTFAKAGANEVAIGLLPGNIAYIRLPTFVSQEAVQNFVKALTQLYAGTDGQINGLIFDLRYNSGGLVTMSLAVSSMFLENGTVTATTTRTDRSITETHYKVMPVPAYLEARMPQPAAEFTHFLQTVPMVVLTNGSTASASEITTGALQDNGRAFVIGVRTFGKAVGFTDTPMPNGGVIQVTNLTYLTPSGKNIADKGIDPNLVVEQPRGKQILSDDDEQVKAAHEHLFKIVQERAKQLAEAQNLSTKPHSGNAAQPAVIHGLYLLLAIMGAATLLSITVFAISRRRRRG